MGVVPSNNSYRLQIVHIKMKLLRVVTFLCVLALVSVAAKQKTTKKHVPAKKTTKKPSGPTARCCKKQVYIQGASDVDGIDINGPYTYAGTGIKDYPRYVLDKGPRKYILVKGATPAVSLFGYGVYVFEAGKTNYEAPLAFPQGQIPTSCIEDPFPEGWTFPASYTTIYNAVVTCLDQEQFLAKPSCPSCKVVMEGEFNGTYTIKDINNDNCDDGCMYSNEADEEFCFEADGKYDTMDEGCHYN